MRSDGLFTTKVAPVVSVAAGIAVALMVLVLPPVVAVVLALGLVGLAALGRLAQLEQAAAALLVATGFTMPMSRVAAGVVPLSDLLLLMVVGLYFLIRLSDTHPPAWPIYRPIIVGLALLSIGGLIGAIFEAPGAYYYKGLHDPIRDVSGWSQNIGNLVKFMGGTFLPILGWMLANPSRALIRRVLGAYALGATLSAAVGIALPMGKLGSRWLGLTVHPIQFGELSLIGLSALAALLMSRAHNRLWGLVAVPILTLGVVGSGSRAALAGLVVLGAIVGPLAKSRAVMGAVLLAAAVAAVLLLGGIVRPEGQNALGRALGNDASAQGSDTARADLTRNMIDRWLERPFTGNGFNYIRPSHNVYLGVLASAGVLGILGLGLIITTILRRLWRGRSDLLVAVVGAGYVAYLLAIYFDYLLWTRWIWFSIGMVVATAASSSAPTIHRPSTPAVDRRAARPA